MTEEVFSGAELFSRPKLARDRADIRARLFQAVIVYAVDRLTRNTAHLAILSDECERAGCRLLFVATDCTNTESGEAYAAEVERQKIVERHEPRTTRQTDAGPPHLQRVGIYTVIAPTIAQAFIS